MALATQCPHCGKRFRVAADQLKLRGGIVRCGACQEIFDGNATLIDLDAVVPAQAGSPAGPADLPAREPAPAPTPAAAGEPETGDAEEPIYTLDFDHTFDPFGILPKPAGAAEHEPEPASQSATPVAQDAQEDAQEDAKPAPAAPEEHIEPAASLPVDEELVAAPLPGHDDFEEATQPLATAAAAHAAPTPPPLLMRESAPAEPLAAPAQPRPPLRAKGAARRSKLTPTKIAAPKLRVPEIDEPEFVKRSRQQEQYGKTRRLLMAAGSAVLLLALAAQGAIIFRNELAARFPASKSALAGACALFGCRVELPARIDNLTIEQGELSALGGNAYSLATLLHNQGNLAQAWPSIELTLNDANDKPLLRRVFVPAEYLPKGGAAAAGFAARAEQPVKLYFQLDQLKPSGYRIAVFYP
jgi:predicted Zn finger-like uncharacterized protein